MRKTKVIMEKPTAGKNDHSPRTREVEKSPDIIGLKKLFLKVGDTNKVWCKNIEQFESHDSREIEKFCFEKKAKDQK